MMILSDMVVDIPVLEGKAFSMDFACHTMESIINSGIFFYDIECILDLVLSFSVLMFCSNVGLCSPAACVCSVDGTRSAFIFFNSLYAWYPSTSPISYSFFSISFLSQPRHQMTVLYLTFLVIVVKYGCLLMKQKFILSGSYGWCFRISSWMGMIFLNSTCLGFFLTISPFKITVAGP